jgi:hypothetical protein
MVKGLLANGDPMFVVSISHFVTIRAFATALSEEFYINSVPFPENLTKKKAEEILRHRLFFHGIKGELKDGCFEAAYEEGEIFNSLYNKATDFIKNKYPWLSK